MPRAPRKAATKATRAPAVPVSLSLDVGPLTLSVESVAWSGLSRAVAALMQARRLLLDEWPELREAECRTLDTLDGGSPVYVPDVGEIHGRRRRAGF